VLNVLDFLSAVDFQHWGYRSSCTTYFTKILNHLSSSRRERERESARASPTRSTPYLIHHTCEHHLSVFSGVIFTLETPINGAAAHTVKTSQHFPLTQPPSPNHRVRDVEHTKFTCCQVKWFGEHKIVYFISICCVTSDEWGGNCHCDHSSPSILHTYVTIDIILIESSVDWLWCFVDHWILMAWWLAEWWFAYALCSISTIISE
jgi:hypothetical protein